MKKYLDRFSSRVVRYWMRIGKGNNSSPEQLKMIRFVLPDEKIIVPALDKGISLLHFRPGSEEMWINILNESGEFGKWNMAKLSQVILANLLPDGGILIVDNHNKPIACSAICLKKSFQPFAVLMNVFVLPEHRRKGISNVMISDALATCHRLGISSISLLTDDYRLPAIKAYLKLGFEPAMTADSDASGRWKQVFTKLEGY